MGLEHLHAARNADPTYSATGHPTVYHACPACELVIADATHHPRNDVHRLSSLREMLADADALSEKAQPQQCSFRL